MKPLIILVWLLALALFLATGAYLVTTGHPYIGVFVFCIIFFLKMKVEE